MMRCVSDTCIFAVYQNHVMTVKKTVRYLKDNLSFYLENFSLKSAFLGEIDHYSTKGVDFNKWHQMNLFFCD